MRDGVAAAVLGLAAAFVVLVALYTAAEAKADPPYYGRVYGSAELYIARAYRSAAWAAVPLAIALLTVCDRKRRRLWRRLALGCVLAGLVWIGYGYWRWAATGFDHP